MVSAYSPVCLCAETRTILSANSEHHEKARVLCYISNIPFEIGRSTMSLKPMAIPPVPSETAQVARAAFPKGNRYLKLREQVGTIVEDADFIALFSKEGAPGLPPWRLALITILQFHEDLSDRQAAEAVRARIDWKYGLS